MCERVTVIVRCESNLYGCSSVVTWLEASELYRPGVYVVEGNYLLRTAHDVRVYLIGYVGIEP